MSKHTPGPWFSEYEAVFGPSGDDRICRIDDCCPVEDGYLIAAAPDLLEACQEYVAWADKVVCKDADLRVIREKIRAAIAKALGEQP